MNQTESETINNANQWMNYMPDFMTPFGMIFYSFIAYVLVTLHRVMRRRTV